MLTTTQAAAKHDRKVLPHLSFPHSPLSTALWAGLAVTLVVVAAYSGYVIVQICGLRNVQSHLAALNRKDSLQLLRIQNDLKSLALAMRDMMENDGPYPLRAWSPQFHRLHTDLDDALRVQEQLAAGRRTAGQRQYLNDSLADFWDSAERIFSLAESGKEAEARTQIRLSLEARQQVLSGTVATLLLENNEAEEQIALRTSDSYNRIQNKAYLFFAAAFLAIFFTGRYLHRVNRQMLARISALSELRSEVAQKLISSQESTFRYISRELHDEFGQILTAIGCMLSRLHRKRTTDPIIDAGLQEIRQTAQTALENVRSLSQTLHPVTLDEEGLEAALDWYLPRLERQAGIRIHYEKAGSPVALENGAEIHVYRILQEALNNVIRHSESPEAWLRMHYESSMLVLEVEDRGRGFERNPAQRGMGLVGMRERAELIGGHLDYLHPLLGGTLVRLSIPRCRMRTIADRFPRTRCSRSTPSTGSRGVTS